MNEDNDEMSCLLSWTTQSATDMKRELHDMYPGHSVLILNLRNARGVIVGETILVFDENYEEFNGKYNWGSNAEKGGVFM